MTKIFVSVYVHVCMCVHVHGCVNKDNRKKMKDVSESLKEFETILKSTYFKKETNWKTVGLLSKLHLLSPI